MKGLLRRLLRAAGVDLIRYPPKPTLPPDLSELERRIVAQVQPFTLTGVDRIVSLIRAVDHVQRAGIPGCIVECGVWKGGSMMTVAETLVAARDTSRHLYLFDTFDGMSEPTGEDQTPDGISAAAHLSHTENTSGYWCRSGLEEVRSNMLSTRYPESLLHFVPGKVEETIPAQAPPAPIALLRLDTDWYESTRHELEHLFARMHQGGVLIIDDYGHWEGARKATDEFLAAQPRPYFLHRIDYTGRLVVKG